MHFIPQLRFVLKGGSNSSYPFPDLYKRRILTKVRIQLNKVRSIDMKFRGIILLIVLASCSTAKGIPFGEFELASISEYEPAEVRRDKRSLTTICVEIKPSSPYEEPYFMCKGTDMPQFSKGSSYGGSGSHSSGYSSKPSYKPKPSYGGSDSYHSEDNYDKPTGYNSDYSAPSKSSYDKKPTYSDHGSHSAYSSYEAPKPSYGAKPSYGHDSHSDYSKPVHKSTYEKPSSHYDSAHSAKPYESSSYGHSDSSGYSKPSSYEHSSYDSRPSYSDGSHSKPSYGNSGTYSGSKSGYSKPSSYSANPTSYDHSGHSSYTQSKPSYSEQSHAKPYTKPAYDQPPSYSSNEYSKPVKSYASSDKTYGQASYKPGYSSPSSHYRAMSEDMMQPMWDVQSQGSQADGLGYRSMDYYHFESPRAIDHDEQQPLYTPLDEPVKMDLSENERVAPTLQAAYPSQLYAPAAVYSPHSGSYGSSQALAVPPYVPIYAPTATPSYTPPKTSYAPATPSYPPSYAPPAPSYAPVTPTYEPPCPQSYIHTLQPAIISLPCFSSSPSYAYGQALGASAGLNLGAPHQFYPSNINPLQDHGMARSDGNSESGKHTEDNSPSTEPQESGKKQEIDSETKSQGTFKNSDSQTKLEETEDKQSEKKAQSPEVNTEEPKQHQTSSKGAETNNTKVAYQAIARMAQIAAQLKKNDSDQGADAAPANQGSDKL